MGAFRRKHRQQLFLHQLRRAFSAAGANLAFRLVEIEPANLLVAVRPVPELDKLLPRGHNLNPAMVVRLVSVILLGIAQR